MTALFTFLVDRPRALWYGIGLPVALVYAAFEFPPSSTLTPDERAAVAAILEFGGLVLIANGYVGLRAKFGRPGLWQTLRKYLKEFLAALWPAAPRTLSASGSGSMGMSGNLRATVRAGPNAPLERRIEIIEGRIDSIDDELQKLSSKLARETSDLRKQLSALKTELDSEVQALRVLVEHASIGDAGSEVVGWMWLLAGITVSSWSSWNAVLAAAP